MAECACANGLTQSICVRSAAVLGRSDLGISSTSDLLRLRFSKRLPVYVISREPLKPSHHPELLCPKTSTLRSNLISCRCALCFANRLSGKNEPT